MIPMVDLKAQYRAIRPEIDAAVQRVLESGQYVLGPEVAAFEEEFAACCRAPHAVAVNSGTSALHLALLAAGVGPGAEVVTVSFTFVATAAAVCYTGARPVFVDIDPRTWTMDPDRVEAAITPRTRAILPVHLHGRPADLDPLLRLAERHGLVLIEDAAQAHGAEYRGRRVGSCGHLACFSFYPGKNLGAYGEGGMVVTADAGAAGTVRGLRDWGQTQKYQHDVLAYNYRMEALQAAILRVKLRHLEAWTEARRAHAAAYGRLLADAGVGTPADPAHARHVYHVYAIRSARRDALQRGLASRGIQTGIHYPIPVHRQKGYADLGRASGDLQASERAAREVLSLPMYPELSGTQIAEVAAAVRETLAEERS
jgi:dTDP-4-amino-4,6-dideoxygalactose transaminase